MNSPEFRNFHHNLGSLIVSTLFVLAGFLTLYDTTSYRDIDSSVFPRAAAIVLIVCATVSIILSLLRSVADEGFGRGSWWRRILLVVVMLTACFAMPHLGFLGATAIAFAGSMVAAMHDQWSKRLLVIYSASGLVIMIAFYALFRYALYVPLP